MRAPATRPQRLVLACVLISTATLGTVSASAASASDRTTATTRTTATAGTAASAVPARQAGAGGRPGASVPSGAAMPAVGYRPTAHAPGDVNTADAAFAACMRGHGQQVFPSFHASKDGKGRVRFDVRVRAAKGFDPASKGYRAAQKACAPVLKKAGISFSTGSGLPGLPPLPAPGRPGGPGGPGGEHGTGTGTGSAGGSVSGSAGGSVGSPRELPGFHTEQAEPGTPARTTLSSVTETA
ncbi:hypothetical protein ACFV06_26970 [Streptomyces sp. NPDC059618]|uniref:hypothetical protein n=1 Tax=Streptomyces sp. NPDC059618 TaxID=3346887 RepID=UPI0036A1683C